MPITPERGSFLHADSQQPFKLAQIRRLNRPTSQFYSRESASVSSAVGFKRKAEDRHHRPAHVRSGSGNLEVLDSLERMQNQGRGNAFRSPESAGPVLPAEMNVTVNVGLSAVAGVEQIGRTLFRFTALFLGEMLTASAMQHYGYLWS